MASKTRYRNMPVASGLAYVDDTLLVTPWMGSLATASAAMTPTDLPTFQKLLSVMSVVVPGMVELCVLGMLSETTGKCSEASPQPSDLCSLHVCRCMCL